MVDRKKLVASAAAAAVLTLGAGTAVIAQQDGLPGKQDEPAITGTLTAPHENEAEGSENEASEGQDPDESLTGSPARRAADAALRVAGGGALLEVEQGDDPNAAYEAEIRKPDGSIVEVMLDGNFNVISQATGD